MHPSLSDLPSTVRFLRKHDALARSIASQGQNYAVSMLKNSQAVYGLMDLMQEWLRRGRTIERAWTVDPRRRQLACVRCVRLVRLE